MRPPLPLAAPAAGAAFLLALLLMAPLRLALGWTNADAAGLSARRVDGTIWSGALHGAAYRGVALGDVRGGLDLFRGGLRVKGEGQLAGEAVVKLRPRGVGLADVDASLPLNRLAAGLPFDGALELDDVAVDFREGACRSASGQAAVSAVRVLGVDQPIPGLRLAGPVACRDGALVGPLTGTGGGVSVDVTLRLDGAGRYEAATRVRATDPAALAAISAGGFERGLDGFTRTDRGLIGAPR